MMASNRYSSLYGDSVLDQDLTAQEFSVKGQKTIVFHDMRIPFTTIQAELRYVDYAHSIKQQQQTKQAPSFTLQLKLCTAYDPDASKASEHIAFNRMYNSIIIRVGNNDFVIIPLNDLFDIEQTVISGQLISTFCFKSDSNTHLILPIPHQHICDSHKTYVQELQSNYQWIQEKAKLLVIVQKLKEDILSNGAHIPEITYLSMT
ncbi:Hypothetical_protein [Hexamita inflata]|uniref:Hypothetical_protein n=1 Tax=Hexamita inflata TaxID=28002 RepID=A0ABP1H961_9EUKA